MEILKDESIVDLLGVVHRSIISFYLFYANQTTGLLNFEAFSRFCSDFEIFPDILSKPKIMRFFKTLSGFFETTNMSQTEQMTLDDQTKCKEITSEDQVKMRRDVIDEHLFVEALALFALEIQYEDPQPNNAEKVSFFTILILRVYIFNDLYITFFGLDCFTFGEIKPQ